MLHAVNLAKKILPEFEVCYWWRHFSTDRLIKQNVNASIYMQRDYL